MASTKIECDTNSSTPTDDDNLTQVIQYAHKLGRRVLLKPYLVPANDPSHWRGEVRFGNDKVAG
ncbi:hypothetical protein ACFLT8_06070 [Chloroflexota bacterium]